MPYADPEKRKIKALEYTRLHRLRHREEINAKRRRALIAGVGGSYSDKEWRELLEQTGRKCLKCGISADFANLTADHIIPLSKGGSNTISNIQPLCKSCNCSKGTKTIRFIQEAA